MKCIMIDNLWSNGLTFPVIKMITPKPSLHEIMNSDLNNDMKMTWNYELWQSSTLTGIQSLNSVYVGLWSGIDEKMWVLELHLVLSLPSRLGISSRILVNFHDKTWLCFIVWLHSSWFLLVRPQGSSLSLSWISSIERWVIHRIITSWLFHEYVLD